MAPQPYVFTSHEDFLDRASRERLAVDTFFANRCEALDQIVRTSVVSNTFRAFPLRKLGLSPSVIYRAWCTAWFMQELETFQGIRTVEAMRAWMIRSANALRAHWLAETNGSHDIGFGRAAKLLGLSVKHLLWYTGITAEEREQLLPLLDVPLDSYTLQGVRTLLPDQRIRSSASMSFVRDEATYGKIQDGIRRLCGNRVSPVHYEFAAWNAAHESVPLRQDRCGSCQPGRPCYR